MGGMKDEAKRMKIPPLFPRVHVNDTGREGLSQPFNGKTMWISSKRPTLPSPTNISETLSTSSLSLPPPPNKSHLIDGPEKNQFSPICNTKFEEKMNKKDMNYHLSPRGSSVTNTKPSSITQNEYLKNLTNLDSVKVPVVKGSERNKQQANTDLSLQFCTSSSNKAGGESVGSKILLSECLEDESLNVMNTRLYRRKFAEFNNETQKKLKTLPRPEQDASDCSAIYSLSDMSAFSYDVARVIGEKRFSKMRTYMLNQQKIFAGQVFELHRLIMVQKMVSKSPELVLESKLNGGKHSTMRSSHQLTMAATSKIRKPNTKNQKPVTEEYQEHMKPKLPLPSISKELMAPIWPQQLLPPPGNQWLVPVMSPSEGLVYKPYAGSCPPPSAFMVPIYGQDSFDTAFRFPVSSQFSHNYIPPSNGKTTIDHTNPYGQYQKWSNTSNHMTQAIPFSLKKSYESDDSEVHGSTASSPPEKHKFEVLQLFPTEPTH